jgi:DNA repair photolyase
MNPSSPNRPEARGYTWRPSSNPHNRFESTVVEWEEGVEMPQALRIHEETAKSILSSNDSPDIPFRYSVNPYRGCAHACAYCYARPTHEYLGLGAGTDFDTQIYAKVNAADLLRKKLASPSWTGEAITFSGVTDCYQPAEARLKLTRACLEACRDHANPVSIITKSSLIVRDLDVLTDLNDAAGAGAVLSVPILDAEVARLIEPFAPPPDIRFKALEKLSRAGLSTGISLGPVIPGLTDSDIPALLARARDCGATFAFYVMLRLPGAVKDVFLRRIREALPGKAGKIEHHIRETRDGDWYRSRFGQRMCGSGRMADMVAQLFDVHCRRLGLGSGERLAALEAHSGPRKKPAVTPDVVSPGKAGREGRGRGKAGKPPPGGTEQMYLGL